MNFARKMTQSLGIGSSPLSLKRALGNVYCTTVMQFLGLKKRRNRLSETPSRSYRYAAPQLCFS
jgi:hypothetical protein